MKPIFLSAQLSVVVALLAFTVQAAENRSENVRRIPPSGLAVPASERSELETGAAELGRQIDVLRTALASKPALLALLPDVQIYHKAVDWALRYDEFYRTNETKMARALLQQGTDRVKALAEGRAPWTSATGLVVRAYQSRIDGSVQPYGLIVPPSFQPNSAHRFRLDFWFHGRSEQLTELSFINERQRSFGEFTPQNAIVVHLYGRYCNANKFAGEMDLFEAWEHIRKNYPIDENRVSVRGFSMGGAACWHFATHHAGLWAAAAPGAGFSETADYLKIFQSGSSPPWYEQKLWHWYDATDYAVNLFNCPTVAYSGEIDKQKQAADMMAKALKAEGIELMHIIGPQTEHRYHPDSKIEINRRTDSIVAKGRDPLPERVKFTTWTLRYNQMKWTTIDALGEHWEQARVDAELDRAGNAVKAVTKNVTALTFSMPSGDCPFDNSRAMTVVIDNQSMLAPAASSDRSWTAQFRKIEDKWQFVPKSDVPSRELRKRHGLQGPIDDAFMDTFIMVRPSGEPMNGKLGAWTIAEMTHAMEQWRGQFRGEARVKVDTEITDADIASSHLLLWGDPSSNRLLAKIAERLPIRWNAQGVHAADTIYPAERYAPVLVCPNPLNPDRYVVLNSGFTFREADYLTNARQTPKLPDYAIIDLSIPPSVRAPGGIAAAGFFNEQWQLPKK